jgi:hypothetical protein
VTKALYYGDNLEILRSEIGSETVDLIYLDPPFNSKANYNVLFRSPKGHAAASAQIEAFEDTWHWGEQAEAEFDQLVHQPNTDVSEMMQALRRFLSENDILILAAFTMQFSFTRKITRTCNGIRSSPNMILITLKVIIGSMMRVVCTAGIT